MTSSTLALSQIFGCLVLQWRVLWHLAMLHVLTEDFQVVNLTLAVDPLRGKHTGNFICQEMSDIFDFWGIQKKDLVLMRKNNASNAVTKACNDCEINHFGCILHLKK